MARLLQVLGSGAALLTLVGSLACAQAQPAPATTQSAPTAEVQNDTLESDPMLARAIDAIIAKAKIDRDHDIPYVAGYSNDGKIIYIDRNLPRGFTYQGKFIDSDRFLILHEAVEKALIDLFDLKYQFAHQVALRAERAAVAAAKVDWEAYDGFMQDNIFKIGKAGITRVPAELDLRPYRDENDTDILARMKAATVPSEGAKGDSAAPAAAGEPSKGRR